MKIKIIYNKDKDLDGEKIKKIIKFLKNKEIYYEIESKYNDFNKKSDENNEKNNNYELILALGGDGTVMHGCKYALIYDVPIIGVNTGKLGFLTQIDINEISQLNNFFDGKYEIDERTVFEVTLSSGKEKYYAINDVVISRKESVKLINIDLYCNLQKVLSYRADGLIISTPTGSTAYSLAAGGPIVDVSLNGLIITPISSHSLAARPIIFDGDKEIKIVAKSENKQLISIDGNVINEIKKDEEVKIKVSNKKYKFVNLNDRFHLKIFDKPIF